MPRDETLKRVESDLAVGKLGIARDRLNGLLSTRPDDLEVRFLLGDVYHRLGYDADAGRCWILLEKPNDIQSAAIDAFIKSCDHNPHAVVKRLKMGLVLGEARERAQRDQIIDMVKRLYQDRPVPSQIVEPQSKTFDRTMAVGCAALVLLFVFVLFVGFYTIASWFIPSKT